MIRSHDFRWPLAVLAILAYFLMLAGGGVKAWFSGDDLMNIAFLHGYGRVSIWTLAVEALTVFTPEYRPVGGVYYRVLYAIFGLRAGPYRVIFFALLLLNVALAANWMRRLSGSSITAFCGALIFSFHAALAELYFNDGTIYDVLCMLFMLLTISIYSAIRQDNRAIGSGDLLIIAITTGLALGSKETALMLPAILAVNEVLFGPRGSTAVQRFRPVLVVGIIALLCMTIKVFVPNQMSINDLYRPRYQMSFIWNSYLHYHRQLLLDPALTSMQLACGVLAMLLVSVLLGSRIMLFGIAFTWLTFFPVCVLPVRAGFVCYVPLLGYSCAIGEAISQIARRAFGFLDVWSASHRFHAAGMRLAPVIFCSLLLVISFGVQAPHAVNLGLPFSTQQHNLKMLLDSARSAAPSLPAEPRILIEKDPFPEVAWEPLFLLRLGYRDPTLWVDRLDQMGGAYRTDDAALYALRISFDGANYIVNRGSRVHASPVDLAISPLIVHRAHWVFLSASVALGGCPIDAAYRMPEDELLRSGIWHNWAVVDSAGHGQAYIDPDTERGAVIVDRIRGCGGSWIPASGHFQIVP